MPQVTKEQIAQAKSLDLITYLRMFEPNNLKHIGNDSYCTVEHDSLKISNQKWNWFSRGIGGSTALQYLISVRGIKFVDAVMKLCSEPVLVFEPVITTKNKEFVLPEAYTNNNRVINYLKDRGISDSIIYYCIENGLVYESKDYHNTVLVGYDEKGTPRYAALRGTWEIDKPFKSEVAGSDKRYCFSIKLQQESKNLIVAESAIDALSVATLRKNPFDSNYLSLGGIYAPKRGNTTAKLPRALATFLDNNENISHITLGLDNDDIGRRASRFIGVKLSRMGYIVKDIPPQNYKDYNDYVINYNKSSPIVR